MTFTFRLKSFYYYLWALISAVYYRFPSNEIHVLGITGTKGKSTTLELVNIIFEEAGYKTALFSSVRAKIADRDEGNKTGNSMPGHGVLQQFLRDAVEEECRYAFIEITSQGVIQYRHRFIDFDGAIFLNLHKEHIEAHGGFENYRSAKVQFFKDVYNSIKKRFWNKGEKKSFFINIDDPEHLHFREVLFDYDGVYFFSKDTISKKEYALHNPLLTEFFKENIAAAVRYAEVMGIEKDIIKSALFKFQGIPGRMNVIRGGKFTIVIDYAHTPDSLEKVYAFLKKNMKAKRLIAVLGSAGGGRDTWKRRVMGEIAARYCDEIILTDEDPYDEDPLCIMSHIKSGIMNTEFPIYKIHEIVNRKSAIRKALILAAKGDIVVLTGKGSEQWIHLSHGRRVLWNEEKVTEEILKTLDGVDKAL